MTFDTPHLTRLLKALNRRAVLLHVVERAGIGMLAGAVAAVLLSGLFWWLQRPVLHWVVLLIAIGLVLGFIWGVLRRPSLLNAAARADEQLQTEDLLATASSLREVPTDPWQQTVLALAERECRALSSSAVKLHRLSGRTWSVISLSAAIAISLGALVNASDPSASTVATNLKSNPVESSRSQKVERPLIVLAPDSSLMPQPGGRSIDEPPEDEKDPTAVPTAPQTQPKAPSEPAVTEANTNNAASPDGGGGGTAKTDVKPQTRPTEVAVNPATSSETAKSGPATKPSGGAGLAGSDNPVNNGTGGTAGAAGGVKPVAPWEGGQVTAGAEGAKAQLDAGRVPAGRRDLVRKYFDLE